MRKIILTIYLTASLALFSQTTVCVYLQNNSYIAINGTTNMVSFRLTQNGDKIANKTFIITAYQSQNKIILNQNEYAIAVKNFNSINNMALRDFLKLMKSNVYPEIKIQLNHIEIQDNSLSNDNLKGQASVNFTITGVTKQYTIPISSKKSGEFYNLTSKIKLSIKDFGLVPPTEMLGLLKVSEWIEIDLNLFCKIAPLK